jgi:hypothetical protein
MTRGDILTTVRDIMLEFAERTGLTASRNPPRRYLWTDAFAVCNFLELHRQTGTRYRRSLSTGVRLLFNTVVIIL